jgi:molybdopterin-biosynthesis enzyme MoeA-like protein
VEVTVGKQRIISLPGPPREMQGMFETHLAPRLATIIGRRTKGMRVKSSLHESGVAPLIQEVMKAHPGTYLKALVSLSDPGALPVDVVAHGATEHDAEERLHAAIATLRERVIAAGGTLGE